MSKKKLPLPKEWKYMPFQMYYSGVEGNTHYNNAKGAGVRHMLMSYYHCRRQGRKMMEERFGDGEIKLLLDSGAHTFNQDIEKYKKKPDSYFEEYIEGYLEWVEKNKDYIFSFVELDLDMIVGLDKVQEWRDKYFAPFEERTGMVCCYVWRSYQGLRKWTEMCKRYRYIGFSSQNDKIPLSLMKKMLAIAKRHGTLVHGLVA